MQAELEQACREAFDTAGIEYNSLSIDFGHEFETDDRFYVIRIRFKQFPHSKWQQVLHVDVVEDCVIRDLACSVVKEARKSLASGPPVRIGILCDDGDDD